MRGDDQRFLPRPSPNQNAGMHCSTQVGACSTQSGEREVRPCKQLRAGVLEVGRGNTPLRKMLRATRPNQNALAHNPSHVCYDDFGSPADAAV